MKKRWIYIIISLILILTVSINIHLFSKKEEEPLKDFCYYNNTSNYILIEKNNINNIRSYLYKDNNDQFVSLIYEGNKAIEIEDLIKNDKLIDYQNKIQELLDLKYPQFIAQNLLLETVKKSYILRNNELVIYFNDYDITPEVEEILYLKVNYNEIKDYLNFSFPLSTNYEVESGYNYTNAKKAVAFTFDDSPNGSKTTTILQSLQNNKAHATFFIVGNKVTPKGKDILLSIKNQGNEIGSHTYAHTNLAQVSDNEFFQDYKLMNDIFKSVFQEEFPLIRPPYGNIKNSQVSLVPATFILWSLDTNDWRYRNKDYIVNYVLEHISDGDIILFHDSYNSTVAAINELLPLLYSKGYQVMSVSELFKLKGIDLETNKIYHQAR